MSNVSFKLAFAFVVFLASSAGSYAQQRATRSAGSFGAGPSAINGIPSRNNPVRSDPSGAGNASRVAPLPPPAMSVPTVPNFRQ